MTNRTEKRALLAVCGAAMALASGCAPSMQYETPSSIALEPTTLETAREANAMLEDYYATRGDLNPNDLIRLNFPYFPSMNTEQRVQLSGHISPPLLDPIQTRGLTIAELQYEMARKYEPLLERPAVSLSVIEYNRPPPQPEIFVMGEVGKPGSFPYRDGISMLEGIARAGGPNQRADMRYVVVLQPMGDRLAARMVDLQSILNGGGGSLDYLSPYAIVIVPSSGLARTGDKVAQIREIIGFNGINLGYSLDILQ
tara:strand:+ start:641 stop:1405 length:765 start_codon:yes stop_codon:yes gene_type:complete